MTTIEKVFDRRSIYWENDLGNNMYSILLQKEFFNYMFKVKGYVFLGDVCNNLGLRLERGLYDLGWSKKNGDEYIDISFSQVKGSNDLRIKFRCSEIV